MAIIKLSLFNISYFELNTIYTQNYKFYSLQHIFKKWKISLQTYDPKVLFLKDSQLYENTDVLITVYDKTKDNQKVDVTCTWYKIQNEQKYKVIQYNHQFYKCNVENIGHKLYVKIFYKQKLLISEKDLGVVLISPDQKRTLNQYLQQKCLMFPSQFKKQEIQLEIDSDFLQFSKAEQNIQVMYTLDYPKIRANQSDNQKLQIIFKQNSKIEQFFNSFQPEFWFESRQVRDLVQLYIICYANKNYLINNNVISNLEKGFDSITKSVKLSVSKQDIVFLEINQIRQELHFQINQNQIVINERNKFKKEIDVLEEELLCTINTYTQLLQDKSNKILDQSIQNLSYNKKDDLELRKKVRKLTEENKELFNKFNLVQSELQQIKQSPSKINGYFTEINQDFNYFNHQSDKVLQQKYIELESKYLELKKINKQILVDIQQQSNVHQYSNIKMENTINISDFGENKMQDFVQQLSNKEQEIQFLKQKNSKLEQNIQGISLDTSVFQNQNQEIKIQIDLLQKQLNDKQKELRLKDKQLQDQNNNSEVQKLKILNDNLLYEIMQFKQNKNEKSLVNLSTHSEEHYYQLEEIKAQNKQYEKIIFSLKQELNNKGQNQLKLNYQELKRKIQFLEDKNVFLDDKNNLLNQQIQDLNAQINNYKQNNQNEQLSELKNPQSNQIDQLVQQNIRLSQDNQELIKQIEEFKQNQKNDSHIVFQENEIDKIQQKCNQLQLDNQQLNIQLQEQQKEEKQDSFLLQDLNTEKSQEQDSIFYQNMFRNEIQELQRQIVEYKQKISEYQLNYIEKEQYDHILQNIKLLQQQIETNNQKYTEEINKLEMQNTQLKLDYQQKMNDKIIEHNQIIQNIQKGQNNFKEFLQDNSLLNQSTSSHHSLDTSQHQTPVESMLNNFQTQVNQKLKLKKDFIKVQNEKLEQYKTKITKLKEQNKQQEELIFMLTFENQKLKDSENNKAKEIETIQNQIQSQQENNLLNEEVIQQQQNQIQELQIHNQSIQKQEEKQNIIDQLNAKNDEIKQILQNQEEQFSLEIKQKQMELTLKETEIKQFQVELQEQQENMEIFELNDEQIKQLQNAIQDYQRNLNLKDEQMTVYEQQIEEKCKELDEKETEISSLNEKVMNDLKGQMQKEREYQELLRKYKLFEKNSIEEYNQLNIQYKELQDFQENQGNKDKQINCLQKEIMQYGRQIRNQKYLQKQIEDLQKKILDLEDSKQVEVNENKFYQNVSQWIQQDIQKQDNFKQDDVQKQQDIQKQEDIQYIDKEKLQHQIQLKDQEIQRLQNTKINTFQIPEKELVKIMDTYEISEGTIKSLQNENKEQAIFILKLRQFLIDGEHKQNEYLQQSEKYRLKVMQVEEESEKMYIQQENIIAQLKEEVQIKKDTITKVGKTYNEQKNYQQKILKENQILDSNLQNEREKLNSQLHKNQGYQEEIKKLHCQNDNLLTEITKNEYSIEKQENENKQLIQSLETLEQEKLDFKINNIDLSEQLQTYQNDIFQVYLQINNKNPEILLQEQTKLQQIEYIQQQINEYQIKISQISQISQNENQNDNQELEKQIQVQSIENQEMNKSLQLQIQENTNQQKQINYYQNQEIQSNKSIQQLQDLYNSISFKYENLLKNINILYKLIDNSNFQEEALDNQQIIEIHKQIIDENSFYQQKQQQFQQTINIMTQEKKKTYVEINEFINNLNNEQETQIDEKSSQDIKDLQKGILNLCYKFRAQVQQLQKEQKQNFEKNVKSQLQELNDILQKQKENYQEIIQENEKLQKEKYHFQKQFEDQTAELDLLKEDLLKLNQQNIQIQQNYEELKDSQSIIQLQSLQYEEKVLVLQNQYQDQEQKHQQDLEIFQQQIETKFENKIQQMNDNAVIMSDEVDKIRKDNQELEAKESIMMKQIQQLQEQNTRISEQYQELYS